MTHSEHASKMNLSRPCSVHDINFGGECFNCGWRPGTYKIVRFYRKSGRRKIIQRGVSLRAAQAHCNDPRTSKAGVWFDGYTQEKTEKNGGENERT